MFDLGMTELMVIGIVALIVVGPKDLPMLFRSVGRFVGKAKGMAREFSRAMDQAADEAGVKEVQQSLKAAANPTQFGMDKVKEAAEGFTSFDPEDSGLSEDRADAARKIHEATAKKAQDRRAAQAAEAEAEAAAQDAAAPKTAEDKT